jgi:hypothetical protein
MHLEEVNQLFYIFCKGVVNQSIAPYWVVAVKVSRDNELCHLIYAYRVLLDARLDLFQYQLGSGHICWLVYCHRLDVH